MLVQIVHCDEVVVFRDGGLPLECVFVIHSDGNALIVDRVVKYLVVCEALYIVAAVAVICHCCSTSLNHS